MFHDRKLNNKINKIHERALRIIHRDSTSDFEEFLIKSNSVSLHQKNLQMLLTEIYKTVNNLNPPFMAEVFVTKDVPYDVTKLWTTAANCVMIKTYKQNETSR